MTASGRGTYIISCRQIEVDGVRLMRLGEMSVGATWRWSGQAAEVDAARDLPLLGAALGEVDVRRRAARQVRRRLEPVVAWDETPRPAPLAPLPGTDGVLSVSDGYRSFTAVLVGASAPQQGFAVFAERLPPPRTELRVTGLSARNQPVPGLRPRGAPSFVGGTMIATPKGPRRVEDLRPGDMIETRDAGPQPLAWKGNRPAGADEVVRLLPNVFAPGVPLAPMFLSAEAGVLVSHPSARTLFGVREVLVRARDLAEAGYARLCAAPEGARYHQLLLERHHVIWAGGVPCASLHAPTLATGALPDRQRLALVEAAPELYRDPTRHGAPARRVLSAAEAALMFHKPQVARLGG